MISVHCRLIEASRVCFVRYKATRGVLITLGDPRGLAMPNTEAELGTEAAG